VRDILLNVILFLPLGLCLGHSRQPRTALLLSFAVSSGIELLQWHAIAGRQASLLDVAANVSGAALGILLGPQLKSWVWPTAGTARRLAAACTLAWLLQCMVVGWGMRADVPPTRRYWGQWAHVFPTTEPFRGVVLGLVVNDMPIPDDSIAATIDLQSTMRERGILLKARLVNGGSVAGRAQIAALADGRGNLLAGASQEGCRYRFTVRARAESMGFNGPSVSAPGACERDSETELTGTATSDALELSIRRPGHPVHLQRHELRSTAGWTFVAPSWMADRAGSFFGLAWVAFFAVPLAWWLADTGLAPLAGALSYLVVIPGLATLIGLLAGQSGLGLPDWGAVIGGLILFVYRACGSERMLRRKMSHMTMDMAT
jgi:hypothetical protein